jgi:hypothetical protein
MWERTRIRNELSLLPLPGRNRERHMQSVAGICRGNFRVPNGRWKPPTIDAPDAIAAWRLTEVDSAVDLIADHKISHGSAGRQPTARSQLLAPSCRRVACARRFSGDAGFEAFRAHI